MKRLKHLKLFEAYFNEAEVVSSTDPLALAILGAPAGGKSYNKALLAKLENLTQIAKAANPNFSKDLTVFKPFVIFIIFVFFSKITERVESPIK